MMISISKNWQSSAKVRIIPRSSNKKQEQTITRYYSYVVITLKIIILVFKLLKQHPQFSLKNICILCAIFFLNFCRWLKRARRNYFAATNFAANEHMKKNQLPNDISISSSQLVPGEENIMRLLQIVFKCCAHRITYQIYLEKDTKKNNFMDDKTM